MDKTMSQLAFCILTTFAALGLQAPVQERFDLIRRGNRNCDRRRFSMVSGWQLSTPKASSSRTCGNRNSIRPTERSGGSTASRHDAIFAGRLLAWATCTWGAHAVGSWNGLAAQCESSVLGPLLPKARGSHWGSNKYFHRPDR